MLVATWYSSMVPSVVRWMQVILLTWCSLAGVALVAPQVARGQCLGDCDGDGRVTVAELVTGVSIALGTSAVSRCAAVDADRDGGVSIAELVRAVGSAIAGCPPTATATAAPTEAPPTPTEPAMPVARISVVVHVVHLGEPIGVGHNLSDEQIAGQIRVLNEDFRRLPGTRGHNTHPHGGDTRLEFVLAARDPGGLPTSGVVRIDASAIENPTPPGSLFDYYAFYGYWDPESYVNVWTMPLPESATDVVLGMATGPETDLPGAELLVPGEPHQAEGILINSAHFGESNRSVRHGLGRTLTHEMGHYFGLLHPWGGGDCERNDYCADTPPVSAPVLGCPDPPPPACDGQATMIENYMNFTDDACMNTFTNDQIARMHYVLEYSPRRRDL